MSLQSPSERLVASVATRLPGPPALGRVRLDHWSVLSAVILGFGLAVFLVVLTTTQSYGQDFLFYRDIGARWLAGGPYYLDRQLHGPYDLALMMDNLYPPTALVLFVPLAVLPLPVAAIAWWVVPLSLIGYQLRRVAPARWAWPILALLVAWPRSGGAVIFGNSDLWVAASVAAGTIWGWPALMLLLKPVFAPLALLGVARRSWWALVPFVVALSVLFIPEWENYVAVIRDSGITPEYSVGGAPLIVMPLIAWLVRTRVDRVPKRHAASTHIAAPGSADP